MKRCEQYIPAKCICITGDAGGGGAVQTIFPILVDSGALSAWAKLKTQKKKVQRTKDAARVIGFADYMNEFDDKVTKMKRSANYDTKVTAIIEDMNMKSSGTKTSQENTTRRLIILQIQYRRRRGQSTPQSKKRMAFILAQQSANVSHSVHCVQLPPAHSAAVDKEIEHRRITLTKPLVNMKWYP